MEHASRVQSELSSRRCCRELCLRGRPHASRVCGHTHGQPRGDGARQYSAYQGSVERSGGNIPEASTFVKLHSWNRCPAVKNANTSGIQRRRRRPRPPRPAVTCSLSFFTTFLTSGNQKIPGKWTAELQVTDLLPVGQRRQDSPLNNVSVKISVHRTLSPLLRELFQRLPEL